MSSSETITGQSEVSQVVAAVAGHVNEVVSEVSQSEVGVAIRDCAENYVKHVENVEAVLQHTAVVDEYLGGDGVAPNKKLPSVVPVAVVAWLRRAWACIGPVVRGCRSGAAVSVSVAHQVADVLEEPDSETLSHDTRLVVDDKAPVAAAAVATEPTVQPTQPPQEENTQAAPADNTVQTEATHQASAEQS